MGCDAMIFNAMARLTNAVPFVEMARSGDLADLPALVDRVMALGISGLGSPASIDCPPRSSE